MMCQRNISLVPAAWCRLLLRHLSEYIQSQCDERASVMSGSERCSGKAGVSPTSTAVTSSFISQSHMHFKLKLVPKYSVTCQVSYTLFFSHHFVCQRYSCPYLNRLLEIHRTSHYEVTKCFRRMRKSFLPFWWQCIRWPARVSGLFHK